MADFGGDIDAFRADARAWLEANFPPSLKGKSGMAYIEDANPDDADIKAWTKAMGEKGWGVPTWPQAYGGGGLSQAEARVLQQEMNRVGAWNPVGGMGTMMFGPTLLEYGNEEQKQKHIRAIAKQEVRWCQGFSEPGAGSDLASLSTKAEDKGDHFLVNGSKIWTSGGQWADMCFCLVRTDTTKKHEGISFLLIDMHDPGVEVRPIRLIAGASPFCETFFTDVKVPKENLVGPLNGGWTIAKRLLQHERSGIGGGGNGGGGGNNIFGVGRQELRRRGRQGPDRRSRPALAHHRPRDGRQGVPAHRLPHDGRVEVEPGPQRHDLDHEERRHQSRPGPRRTAARSDGHAGPRLGGRRVHLQRALHRSRLAGRQGHHHFRWLAGNPKQHHFQADPGLRSE